jgi:hypothetical protein
MRHFYLLSIVALVGLTACNSMKEPSATNFKKAINQYLTKHGEACTMIGHQFPVDVSESEERLQAGIALQMAALEEAGMVHSRNTTAVVHGLLDPLRGPTPPQPVKRYELTEEGKRYFRQTPGVFGQTDSFCYGQETVDSIVQWTEPMTMRASTQTEVTYTYKIVAPARWAESPNVQHVFSDIQTTVSGASITHQVVGLELTDRGWEVPGQ